MRLVFGFLSLFVVTAWLGVASAGLFPNGATPAFPKVLIGASKPHENVQKREADVQQQPFRNSWVVEFNELLTSIEDFAIQHNVIVRRIGETNLYTVRQKHATYGQDIEKQNTLASDPRVRSIEFQIPQKRVPRQIPTTDPGLCQQWHLLQCPESVLQAVDINVKPAWQKGYTGNGIQIAVVDDGVEFTHPDLAASYSPDDSYDFFNDDNDPSPDPAWEWHGTACAGLAVAGSNSYCGVGSAYEATFAAIKLLGTTGGTDDTEAASLMFRSNNNHIYSNSWGPPDDGQTYVAPGPLTNAALSSTAGRGGKGNIFLFAGGNGRLNYDQTAKDGYSGHPNVIGVVATNASGQAAYYSEYGSTIFIAAPGGDDDHGIYTTDISGNPGATTSDCRNEFSGTSAATPIVSGVVALILEANPELTNRDVRRILGLTAQKNDRANTAWLKNGANHWMNYNYGFGIVNADKAVEAAKIWRNLPALASSPAVSAAPNAATGAATCYNVVYPVNVTIEYIAVYVNLVHTARGDMSIAAVSPKGTLVMLLFADGADRNNDIAWTFHTYFFMDEYSQGTWRICFEDMFTDADVGTIVNFELSVSGRPVENFVTTAQVDSVVPGPYLNELVNITITFSDNEGIFAYSIGAESVVLGGQFPVSVEVVATTSTSATAVFTFDLSADVFTENTFEIKTTEISVQNQWLNVMSAEVVIGSVDLIPRPPLPPQAPQAQPGGLVSAASIAVASIFVIATFCALISVS